MIQPFSKAILYILKQTWTVGVWWKVEALATTVFGLAIVDTFLHFIDEQGFLLGWFFFVIVLDHITGVGRADLAGEKISTNGYRRTGLKIFVYLANIYMIAALPYMFHGSVVSFIAEWGSKAVLLWHSFTEVSSIAENTGNRSLTRSIGIGFKAIGKHLADQRKPHHDEDERR